MKLARAYTDADFERMLKRVDDAPFHALPYEAIDDVDDHRILVELKGMGMTKIAPPKGRFPERWVLTYDGMKAMGTFEHEKMAASLARRVVARFRKMLNKLA